MADPGTHNISVIIPTYNESGTIRTLIESLEKQNNDNQIRIIVIDDGSADGTIDMINELSKRHGNINLIERGRKLGFGTAIRDGLKAALNLEPPPDLIATMDADLSHDPRDLPTLIEACDRDTLV